MEINELSPGGGMPVAAPFNYQQEQEKLKQQQLLAQSLLKTKTPEGQMVSGWYVAPGAGQYIAAGLDKLMGAYGQYQANEQAGEVETKRKQLLTDALSKFGQVDADGKPVAVTPGQQLQYAQTAMELDPDGIGKVIGANAVNNIINPKSTWEAIPQGGLYNTKTKERIEASPKQVDPAVQAQREATAQNARENLEIKKQQADDKREASKEEVSTKMNLIESGITDTNRAIDLIDTIANHKGANDAMGLQGMVYRRIPNTDAYDMAAKVEELKSSTFTEAVKVLKGMGALSDAEGKKLDVLRGNLDLNQTPKQFQATLAGIKTIFETAKQQALTQYGTHGARLKSLGGKYITESEISARSAKEGWDVKETTDYLKAQGYKIGK